MKGCDLRFARLLGRIFTCYEYLCSRGLPAGYEAAGPELKPVSTVPLNGDGILAHGLVFAVRHPETLAGPEDF